MTLGLGRAAVVKVAADDALRDGRRRRSQRAIAEDRAAGRRPIAIVATVGTTSSTSVDPVAAIADVAEREGLWLHVDAAYAGVVAILPERRAPFAGWERADSIVVNPHKWLFTPLDASLLLTRRMDQLRAAFSLVPEYLRTLDRANPVLDYNEYQPQLGRRMRALKLWMQLRWFGLDGLRRRIAAHLARGASASPGWVDADPRLGAARARAVLDRLLPLPARAALAAGRGRAAPDSTLNTALMDAVNRTGEVFLSHTRLRGRFTIRLAIGNLRTEPRHVERAWDAAPREAAALPDPPEEHPMTGPDRRSCTSTARGGAAHDEFVELFRRNHWPILQEQLAAGRYTDVELFTPRFHGDGRADWDILVSITYRDWAAIEEHSDAEIARAAVPGPGGVQGRGARGGSSCSRRTGTWCWSRARWTADLRDTVSLTRSTAEASRSPCRPSPS